MSNVSMSNVRLFNVNEECILIIIFFVIMQ